MTLPKNIFFVGATGGLGHVIAHELLKNKHFHVKVLVRKDTIQLKKEAVESLKKEGAHIVEGSTLPLLLTIDPETGVVDSLHSHSLFYVLLGDVKDEAHLTELLKGSDTVLSVLGGPSLFDDSQAILVRAAKVGGPIPLC